MRRKEFEGSRQRERGQSKRSPLPALAGSDRALRERGLTDLRVPGGAARMRGWQRQKERRVLCQHGLG
jgi:hypothetical protein